MTQPYQIEVLGMEPQINEKVGQALSILHNLEVEDIEKKTLIYQVAIIKLIEHLMAQTAVMKKDYDKLKGAYESLWDHISDCCGCLNLSLIDKKIMEEYHLNPDL